MKRISFIPTLSVLFLASGAVPAAENPSVWGACPIEDRAYIVKIDSGKTPDIEIITVRYIKGGKEVALPEYRKGVNGFIPKIGGPFCMADDTE